MDKGMAARAGGDTGGGGGPPTDAVRTQSQQSAIDRPPPAAPNPRQTRHVARVGVHYEHGANLTRPAFSEPYSRVADRDPLYRPLRIYTSDPLRRAYEGAVAVVQVPYEPLEPGPVGRRLEVVVEGPDPEEPWRPRAPDLDAGGVLIAQGLAPAPGDLRFHRQMVYAVASMVSASFAVALGREPSWGFARREDGAPDRLRLRPHFGEVANAFYDKGTGELRFGWFAAGEHAAAGAAAVPPGGRVYACLSHDIIAHEMAHALLDGMRRRFDEPTNSDVLAFHEAFADIVAVLQQFSYRAGVLEALRRGGGRLGAGVILALAEQFGQATGGQGALRAWLDRKGKPALYDAAMDPHALGSVLAGAVLDALAEVFERRVARLRGIYALSGMPRAHLHPHYLELLADGAAKVAGQFLTLCIRAIDYCPPVDVTFGEYLRALITADRDLVEDDPLGYREALIAAFGRRGIFPPDVHDLSEDSLRWRGPLRPLGVEALNLASLRLPPDPSFAPEPAEIERQAGALADLVTHPDHAAEFGLDAAARGAGAVPVIESVRTLRRVGPDRQVRFGIVAEVVQRRRVRVGGREREVHGGATVILGGAGEVRYVIRKRIDDLERAKRTDAFLRDPVGGRAARAAAEGKTWLAMHGAAER